jgi:hypothetical protein
MSQIDIFDELMSAHDVLLTAADSLAIITEKSMAYHLQQREIKPSKSSAKPANGNTPRHTRGEIENALRYFTNLALALHDNSQDYSHLQH